MTPLAPPVAHVTPPFAELSRLTPPAHVRPVTPIAAPFGWTTYDVRRGDTLFELALRHRGGVDALAARNGMPASTVLREGQRILVPRRAASGEDAPVGGAADAAATGETSVTSTTSGATRAGRTDTHLSPVGAAAPATFSPHAGYVVRPGDTIAGIAARLRVDPAALARANDLGDPDLVVPGRRLVVPGGREAFKARTTAARAAAARAGTRVAVARAGDTVADVARRHGVSRAAVLKANDLPADARIHAGARLRLPRVAGDRTPAADPRVAAHVAANRAHLDAARLPDRLATRGIVVDVARRHGVDPALALAVAWQESRWTQRAVSPANAVGVMQCLPSTGRWVSARLGRDLDLLSTRDNVTCGVGLLRALTRATTSDREAVAAYYQGLASVRAHGLYPDTQAYVESVLAHRERL